MNINELNKNIKLGINTPIFNLFYRDNNIIIYLKLLNQMVKNKIIDNVYITHDNHYYEYYTYSNLKRTDDDNKLINFYEFEYIKFIITIDSKDELCKYTNNNYQHKNNLYYQFYEKHYIATIFKNINNLITYVKTRKNIKIIQDNELYKCKIEQFPTMYRTIIFKKMAKINNMKLDRFINNYSLYEDNKRLDEYTKKYNINIKPISEIINETPHKNKYCISPYFIRELDIRNELINDYMLK